MTGATAKARPVRADWWSKSAAGLLLGLALGLLAGNFVALLGAPLPPPVRAQLAMWVVVPVWFTVLGTVYLFRSGIRAWAWLSAALLAGTALVLLLPRAAG